MLFFKTRDMARNFARRTGRKIVDARQTRGAWAVAVIG